ncbi:hypothetical protein C0Q44_12120 [Paenibacillus sp. PCH8]|uniref:ABC transporter substrate-binding protein n=1 Tax=Paenibacillus sp. PCH8 TaxID=2066524 RepID=UPI000CF8F441|nr:ABC transporter substrate-binding protein [Paenibacillus sp. PCH8]PQP85196.1 hypothetical protein C0Q44_12120 [Paenibacillus sp. PCH8]
MTLIANTLMLERNEDWRDTLKKFGKIMDKDQEADQVLDQYNTRITEMKSALSAKLGEDIVALFRPKDNSVCLHTTSHLTASILYGDLRMNAPKLMENDKDNSTMIFVEILLNLMAITSLF